MKIYLALALAVVLALIVASDAVRAAPVPDTATCSISVTVAEIMEWAANFPAIALANITAQDTQPTGSANLDLYTNGDVDITAQNGAAAQLTDGTDTLVTEYQLTDDGNGVADTGMVTDVTSWTAYDTFLTGGGEGDVTHVPTDGAVQITLQVRASNPVGEVADAGVYGATQTLTATWVP